MSIDTLQGLYARNTVGYSHRGGGRQPIPDPSWPAKIARRSSTSARLSTPVPANALPGRHAASWNWVMSSACTDELSSFPIFRHNGRPAEMVQAELAGAFEAPVYGMIEVGKALDTMDWTGCRKARSLRCTASPSTNRSPCCCGMANGK